MSDRDPPPFNIRASGSIKAGSAHDPLNLRVAPEGSKPAAPWFKRGDRVRKKSGSEWQGYVCGEYSTSLTLRGYCVESEFHAGSVQLYPATALELVP